METSARNTLRQTTRPWLLGICVFFLTAHFPLSPASPAPARNYWSECGADAAGCDSAAIKEFYKEYARKVMNQPGGRRRDLELLAGGTHAIDALLKAFLNAGYEVKSQDIQDFPSRVYDPNSVWLYTQPGYAGILRQYRTGTASVPGAVPYRSVRLGHKVYVELFSESRYAGAWITAYSSISDLSASGRPVSPKSLKLHKRAAITVNPVYSIEARKGPPRPVIGVAARVSLDKLNVQIATEHQPCDTPCYDSACPSDAGFFYDPVYPVYDPKAPEKAWYGRYAMQLMINTGYFKVCAKANYHQARCANGSGLLIKSGQKLLNENVRDDQGNLLDAIVFWKNGRVELFLNKDIPKDLRKAEVALAGNWFFSGEEYHCNGCHDADSRQPRTALGLDQSNRNLTIIVIQPGNADRDDSLTARELQSVMREMGVSRGFMLDGGGSSQFVYIRADGDPAWTVPPGDKEGYRPVPSAFGIVGLKDPR